MSKFYCYTSLACRREDDAVAVNEDGSISVAIVLPTDTNAVNTCCSKHIDHMRISISDVKCRFDRSCTNAKCTFLHTNPAKNNPFTELVKVTPLKPNERAGFQEGKKTKAIIIKMYPIENRAETAYIDDINVEFIYQEQPMPPSHLEQALRFANDPKYAGQYTGDIMIFDEYTLTKEGEKKRVERLYDLRRFFLETCLDEFSSAAFAYSLPLGSILMAQAYNEGKTRFEVRRNRVKGTAFMIDKDNMHNLADMGIASGSYVLCSFTHPLRDYECMHNILALAKLLPGGESTFNEHEDDTYLIERNRILKYINNMCYAQP